ncbi:pyridoxamine 5'-phosphate oxidase family protein [Rhizobium sp. WSM1325]|uniref:pyridoxamine 5'-phosphate oxidase family protein n=1 Tax=Rhizobium sp. WSM1325 TaxID=3444086 RepID=UPI000FF4B7D3|nr:pyridoxamine 5'-phosphate oxidase family protein [Rhizobium leguminosarum]RWY70026.1 hypothetical protein EHI48_27040 [Rhizobium leguminosarum]
MKDMRHLDHIWERLGAMADGSAGSAAVQLTTIGDTGFPGLRTVILRDANFDQATVSFVTDIRSTKVKHIRNHPMVSAIAYDLESRVQITLLGRAAVVENEDARRSMWDRLKPHTHKQFEAALPPGISLYDDGRPVSWEDDTGPMEPYERFALISISVASAEWLNVSGDEKMRFIFYRDRRPKWHGSRFSR